MTSIIQHLPEVAGDYDILFCDVWGVLHDGQRVFPAAATALQRFRAGGGYAKSLEHTIHTAPDRRGRGLGAALLDHVESHARRAGGRLMIAAVTGANVGSIRFHAGRGYAEWGRIPAAGWKFGQFHDLVLMGKDLSALPPLPPSPHPQKGAPC